MSELQAERRAAAARQRSQQGGDGAQGRALLRGDNDPGARAAQ